MRILRRFYTNNLRKIYAILRRDYAKVFTHALRIITHALRRNYANKLCTLRKYYAKVTQIIYAIITQTLFNVYAKLRKDVYAQYAIITQMGLRKHYVHFPCLRNILRRFYANNLRNSLRSLRNSITQIHLRNYHNFFTHVTQIPIFITQVYAKRATC